MTAKILWRLLTVKTLIRVAFTVLSLGGIAQAQSAGKFSPPQSGNNYNFTNGGGG